MYDSQGFVLFLLGRVVVHWNAINFGKKTYFECHVIAYAACAWKCNLFKFIQKHWNMCRKIQTYNDINCTLGYQVKLHHFPLFVFQGCIWVWKVQYIFVECTIKCSKTLTVYKLHTFFRSLWKLWTTHQIILLDFTSGGRKVVPHSAVIQRYPGVLHGASYIGYIWGLETI